MPRPRLYKDNAAKQRAYRERRAAAEAKVPVQEGHSPGHSALVDRVLAMDTRAREREQ